MNLLCSLSNARTEITNKQSPIKKSQTAIWPAKNIVLMRASWGVVKTIVIVNKLTKTARMPKINKKVFKAMLPRRDREVNEALVLSW